MRATILLAVLFLVFQSAVAQNKGDASLQVREEDGGSVAVRTANGVLNQGSSLKRTWYVIDDLKAPASLDHAGVFPRLDEKEKLQYIVPVGIVSPKQATSAVELRYVLFDVWGQRLRTLSVTQLADSSTHIDFRGSNKWVALESEVSQLVTVVSFVARVRTAEGGVWRFDAGRVVPPLQDLGLNVVPADLIPDEQRMISPGLIYWTYSPKDGEAVKAAGVLRP
jgi:hypothetical protein